MAKVQIYELTGLRGLAALFILINHIVLLYPALRSSHFFPYFSWFGFMGMDLFFILSGFVIFYNYADKILCDKKKGIFEFLAARFARLYPLYFVFIIFYFILNFIKSDNIEFLSTNIVTLPTFLTGMQSWVYGFIGDIPIVHSQGNANISWSVSTEFALYLFFIPLVLFLGKLKKISIKNSVIILFSLMLINILWRYYCLLENCPISNYFNYIFGEHNFKPSEWLTFQSPFARIWQFLSGCVIAQLFMLNNCKQDKKQYKFLAVFSLIILILCVVFNNQFIFLDHNKAYISSILLTFIVLSVVFSPNKFLKSKIMILAGEISYSTYLLHIILIDLLHYLGYYSMSYIINLPLFLIYTYLIAYYVYKFYEKPARDKLREFLITK